MKNATRYCAGPAYYRMRSVRRLLFKTTKPAAVAPKETITSIISSFLNWAEENPFSMQPKFVAAQKYTNRNPANIRKWIARFYYFSICAPLKRVYCSQ